MSLTSFQRHLLHSTLLFSCSCRLGLKQFCPCSIYFTLFLTGDDNINVSALLLVLNRISDRTELVPGLFARGSGIA